jgi:iron complex outermembrane receptor protein
MQHTKLSLVTLLFLSSSSLHSEELLGDITIEEDKEKQEESLSYCYIHNVQALSKRKGAGETLGDYLSGELGVESATYGSAVGRPTVNGMEGYRVGIAQGGVMLNDLSAMSQDHAVGLNAKVAEHLELVKGPASLLYGAYSGGIVRTLGEEHDPKLPKGFGGNASLSSNSDTGKGTANVKAEYGNDSYSAYLNYYRNEAGNYSSGGQEVANSDTFSEQLHGVLGWKATDKTTVKVYGDTMEKEYGIPNTTAERTDILMEQQRYGVVVHNEELGKLKNVQTEYQFSDYKHFEREGVSYDGAFDQEQQSLSTAFDFNVNEMDGNFRMELLENQLKVCHEHGNCQEFTTAARTSAEDGFSVQNYYNDRGIAYSHGHPMPNTEEQKLQMGVSLKKYYEEDELNFAANTVVRQLTADNANIQETWLMPTAIDSDYYGDQNDMALSLSLGWWHIWSDKFTSQASLAYMERLPSSQELFWNGFHHATESYILGNRDLDKEKSVNLDVNMLYAHNEHFNSKLSAYYYHFDNYIYQSPLAQNGTTITDPFHLSPVWEMRGVGAKIYGLGVEERYKVALGKHKFTNTLQLNMLRGQLDEGGNIPRMAPYNATISVEHRHDNLTNKIAYKWVDKSRHVANHETSTDGYQLLNVSINYEQKLGKSKLNYWLKGENLTDDIARNHISFLKETAPLPGRAFIAGIEYQY